MSQADSIEKAARDSLDFWITQHPMTLQTLFETAVRDAVAAWLTEHHQEILEAIKQAHTPEK